MQLSWAITRQISRGKPGDPRREGRWEGEGTGGRDGREERTDGREGGTDGWEGGRERCDGTYEVGAYGMERVHNREPERSQVDLQPASQ